MAMPDLIVIMLIVLILFLAVSHWVETRRREAYRDRLMEVLERWRGSKLEANLDLDMIDAEIEILLNDRVVK